MRRNTCIIVVSLVYANKGVIKKVERLSKVFIPYSVVSDMLAYV